MLTRFVEATQPNHVNHGKFMLGRLSPEELGLRTAMPGYEDQRLVTFAGRRKLDECSTLVLDLQTGEGACFTLAGSASIDLKKHKIWVCPMFEPFLVWLYAQGLGEGAGSLDDIPRYVEVEAEPAMFGYRREGQA